LIVHPDASMFLEDRDSDFVFHTNVGVALFFPPEAGKMGPYKIAIGKSSN